MLSATVGLLSLVHMLVAAAIVDILSSLITPAGTDTARSVREVWLLGG